MSEAPRLIKNCWADMNVRSPNINVVNVWRLMSENSSAQKKLEPFTGRLSSIWPRMNDLSCGFSRKSFNSSDSTLHDQLGEPVEAVGSDHNCLKRIAIGNDACSLHMILNGKSRCRWIEWVIFDNQWFQIRQMETRELLYVGKAVI